MIRVILVDDQQLVRAGLRMLCESDSGIEVVAEADNGRDAVRLVDELRPDVVMMDLRMPGMDGTTATAQILANQPTCRIVVVTTFDDDDHLYPALAAGACGFLVKDAAPAELLDGIRKAADGDSPFSQAVLRRLVDRAVRSREAVAPTPAPVLAALTTRERDVLELVGEGLSNQEIADRLHLGVTTVKTHITNLMTKTNSPNRVRLAVLALRASS
jgi:DNA-binding NarL/FixJ family response regulator